MIWKKIFFNPWLRTGKLRYEPELLSEQLLQNAHTNVMDSLLGVALLPSRVIVLVVKVFANPPPKKKKKK